MGVCPAAHLFNEPKRRMFRAATVQPRGGAPERDNMEPDDKVCLCFHVSQRKIVNFCKRERPKFASVISQCLSAGTGCGWCIPFLKKLHEQAIAGEEHPDLPVSPEEYARRRARYRTTGLRDEEPAADSTGSPSDDSSASGDPS